MRSLNSLEVSCISGGESTYYYFDLLPNVEVVGFEKELIGYDLTEWTESTGWFSSTNYVVETPIYAYYPVYATTYTF